MLFHTPNVVTYSSSCAESVDVSEATQSREALSNASARGLLALSPGVAERIGICPGTDDSGPNEASAAPSASPGPHAANSEPPYMTAVRTSKRPAPFALAVSSVDDEPPRAMYRTPPSTFPAPGGPPSPMSQ